MDLSMLVRSAHACTHALAIVADCMFQIVDTWVNSVEESDYLKSLQYLAGVIWYLLHAPYTPRCVSLCAVEIRIRDRLSSHAPGRTAKCI